MDDLNKMVSRIVDLSDQAKAADAVAKITGGRSPYMGDMPLPPSPALIRRGEREEVIAAILAAGILAAHGGLTTLPEAKHTYFQMLAELRDPKGDTFCG